jgi:phosphoribosylanthranilate isomerase
MRTRVKICGITRRQDALAAVAAGADAIGLVFYDRSPRHVTVQQAREITAKLPPFVTVVGLFVDAHSDLVNSVLEQTRVDLLQFHGGEVEADCTRYRHPYIKALRMQEGTDLRAESERYPTAAALLLDSYDAGLPGGTGTTFDWGRVPADLGRHVVLAGGLNPDNVAQALAQLRPYAVDVSSGVEESPGIKNAKLIEAFMKAVVKSEV